MKERENSDESERGENIVDVSEDKGKRIENAGNGFLLEKSVDYFGDSSENIMRNFEGFVAGGGGGASSESRRTGNSGFQELTFSYLCDNAKDGASGKNLLNSFEKKDSDGGAYKGKEVLVSEDQNEENNRWVERDFLCLNGNKVSSYKREVEENLENEGGKREKKTRMETLNLSLALPDVSLSIAGSNRVQNGDSMAPNIEFPARLSSIRSIQSVEPTNSNQQTAYSNDFTAASLSYSYSHPYSHNPSCSLTRNSTDYYEYSTGSHRRDRDQIWNAGEGTNGSVHSRFRPIGDGTVALANPSPGGVVLGNNKDTSNNSFYKAASSENISFFPSELPARPRWDAQSGDSRGKGSENLGGFENLDGGRARKLSRPERLLREIVSESIPVMSQLVQDLPEETVESTKEYLKNLIAKPERKDELISLQNRLDRRSDLTTETLSKAHKIQLDILVAIKMGLGVYLSSKICLPSAELVDIFLLERCRNINCKRVLPVDDCDCKICSTKKGFCNECMCPVCLKFDCASNTCSWVGCDACSHWCHATCGIEKNLIRPGPTLKGPSGATEMQFNCLGCGHACEMFGFVKDVYISCARDWGLETLIKELECVRKIFRGSEDRKGKELYFKADEILSKLQNKLMSPQDACNFIFQFFNYVDAYPDFSTSTIPSKDAPVLPSLRNDACAVPPSNSTALKSSFYGMSSSSGRKDLLPVDLYESDVRTPPMNENKIVEDEWSVKPVKKDGFDSLESIVVVKEAEARMFQNRADEARREAEGFRRMVRIKVEKLEEEYAEKIAKLCLQETEEKRKKKLEELKALENSHGDYYKMKMRMQVEIAGLLKRMEATKQLWVSSVPM
ncbi:OLC1v1033110C1 [Oldenlandia corymbosa var. corymbosa]|uniref:OLC1v1033110C1 n=1 Tax=Oldenlandia corymbosa var. corymbosa TaxID=529605 RepID=A0AAV1CMM1_OLDCO|nr:OLC1v1033110C1 [Oldenlandia corymbosa var. corymbosa]